jgi:MFS transporter, CP family, cyanate transporter
MDKKKYGRQGLAVLIAALFICNYFQYQLSPLASRLMEEMNLTSVQFSAAFSSPMIPAIALGIVLGILSDKFGVKAVTTVGLSFTAAALCYRPFAGTYATLMGSMIIAGIGVTSINVNMSKLVGAWYPADKVSQLVGMSMVGNSLGMTVGTATTAMFPSTKSAFMVSGVAAAVVLVLWILFVKVDEGKGTAKQESKQESGESAIGALLTVMKSKNVWLVSICLMFLMGSYVAMTSFLPTALASRGISESTAGVLSSVFTVGSLCGNLIAPTLINKSGKMRQMLALFGIVAGVCAAVAWRLPVALIAVALFLAGFLLGGPTPVFMSFPMMLPEIGPKYAGSAGGIITTLELLGAVVLPTYVFTPLAGQNFTVYFIMAGAASIAMAVVAMMLPDMEE